LPGQLLWDIGAGSGAVAVEWCRAVSGARAVAVERDPARAARIEANAQRLGVPEIRVLAGCAPGCLDGLEPPDAIFVGGSVRERPLLDRLWARLRPGGRLVAHAVTLEAERALLDLHAATSGELTRLAVARAEPIGRLLGWRPLMPVTQLAARKPCARVG
jgi:precorrin-6Y C5,15-methyltransferase (decarboxylating)